MWYSNSLIQHSLSSGLTMKSILSLVLALVINTVAVAQVLLNSSTEPSLTDKVDKLFAKWDKPDLTGCSVGIVKDGKLIYKRGYGVANLDYNTPISPASVFNVGLK